MNDKECKGQKKEKHHTHTSLESLLRSPSFAGVTDYEYFTPQHLQDVESVIMQLPNRASTFVAESSSVKLLFTPTDHTRGCQTLFLGLVLDSSMRKDGILRGDILVVDRLVLPVLGDVVVIKVRDHHVIGRLYWGKHFSYMVPSHKKSPILVLLSSRSYTVLGVVTDVNRSLKSFVVTPKK